MSILLPAGTINECGAYWQFFLIDQQRLAGPELF
jgi:hypothetical protein